eukprot:4825-Heterococcus_DN1.PRE.1
MKNRASVMLKLPKLYKAWGVHKLEDYCDKMGVQARGAKVRLTYIQTLLILLAVQLLDTAVASALLLALLKPIWCSVAATPANSFSSVLSQGEHSPPGPNGEFDISNKYRIGYSEVELMQSMIDGVDK